MSNNNPQNPYQQDQSNQGQYGNQSQQDQYGNQNQSQQDQYGNPNQQGQQDQYGNPNQQGQQDQYGNPNQGQYGNQNQQDQYGNQNQQGQYGNQNQQGQYGNQNQGQQGLMGDARQTAENQIDQVIDQLGNKIPGGSQYTQQAKNAAGGALNDLEQEAEKRMGNLGGLFGGDQNKQNQ